MLTYIPSHWPTVLMVLFLVLALYTSKRTTWIRQKKNTIVTFGILSVVLLPLQGLYLANLWSFQFGELHDIGGNVSLAPQETHVSTQLSNWYTEVSFHLVVSSQGGEVTIYFVDENNPDVRYDERNYTSSSEYIRLPYSFTGWFQVAEWTLHFYNPSINQTIQVEYHRMPPPPNGPLGTGVMYIYFIPIVIWLSFAVLMGVASFVVNQLKPDRDREILSIFSLFLSILFAYMIFNYALGVIVTGLLFICSPFLFFGLLIAIFVSAMRSIQDETTGTDS